MKQTRMQTWETWIILSIMVIFALTGCSAGKIELSPSPNAAIEHVDTPASTAEPVITLSPTFTQGQTLTATITRTPRPTHTATPTQIPNSLNLVDFPIAVNAVWKYSVEIAALKPGTADEIDGWSGEITRKVIGVHESETGETVFSVELAMDPAPPDHVWTQPRTEEFTLVNGGILRNGIKIYQWPLSDGAEWKAWPDAEYTWNVSGEQQVVTPYGTFENCYSLTLFTYPDTTVETVCPGVGMIGREYWHHGDPQMEHWVLISFEP